MLDRARDFVLKYARGIKITGAFILQVFIIAVTVFVTAHFVKKTQPAIVTPPPIVIENPAAVKEAVHNALADTAQREPTVIQKVVGLMSPAPATHTTIYRMYTPVDSVLIANLFLMSRITIHGDQLTTTSFNQSQMTMMERSFLLKHRDWQLGTNSRGPYINEYRRVFEFQGVWLGPVYGFPEGPTVRLWGEADFMEALRLSAEIRPNKIEAGIGWKVW